MKTPPAKSFDPLDEEEKEWMDFGEKYFRNFKNNINGFQLIKKHIKKISEESKLLADAKSN